MDGVVYIYNIRYMYREIVALRFPMDIREETQERRERVLYVTV
jgi:hypothetical protein